MDLEVLVLLRQDGQKSLSGTQNLSAGYFAAGSDKQVGGDNNNAYFNDLTTYLGEYSELGI